VNALALDTLIASGQAIALWGWGREGRAAYRALRTRSGIPLTLFCTEADAADARILNDPALNIEIEASAKRLSAFNLIIKSPGISPYRPEALEAAAHGTRFVGGTALWFASRPDAHTICVTGTKGKSTTTALLAHLLRAAGQRTALAGNIGLPLLELVDTDADYWAIELSSYQTRDVAASGVRPDIAIVTNLFPEHLDWHGDESRYLADKLALLHEAKPHIAILNAHDPQLSTLQLPDSRIILFGHPQGWHLRGEWLYRGDAAILDTTSLLLPGLHNRQNLCAVLTAIDALNPSPRKERADRRPARCLPLPFVGEGEGGEGVREARKPTNFTQPMHYWDGSVTLLARHLQTFTPLPHRLQSLGKQGNILWINDSISTTPHATLAALDVYKGQPIALLLGGFDRGLDWTHFAHMIQSHPPHTIILLGQTAPRLNTLLEPLAAATHLFHLHTAANLPEAVTLARSALGQDGGIALLSPGAPSFDTHRDYTARGQHFAELAGFDPTSIRTMTGMGIE